MLPQIEKRTGVKFEYVPILLGGVFKLTNNRSLAESLVGIKNKPEYERLEMTRFIRRHGITRFSLWQPPSANRVRYSDHGEQSSLILSLFI